MIKWLIGLLVFATLTNADQGVGQQFKPRLDCKTLGDGNYVYGCNKVFWMCSNGNLHAQHCLDQLFFDPVTNACEHAENIDLCSQQNDTLATVPTKATDPFTCKGKPDGTYGMSQCGQGFVHCNDEIEIAQICPSDLIWNQEEQYCDFATGVKTCKKSLVPRALPEQQDLTLPAGSAPGYGPQDSVQQDQPSDQHSSYTPQIKTHEPTTVNSKQTFAPVAAQQPSQPVAPPRYSYNQQQAVQQTPPASNFDCSARQDGIYPSPLNACETFFWRCTNKEAIKHHCPAGLYFSTQNVHCALYETVPECNGNVQPYPTQPLQPPLIGVHASPQQQPSISNNYGQVQTPTLQQQPAAPKTYEQQPAPQLPLDQQLTSQNSHPSPVVQQKQPLSPGNYGQVQSPPPRMQQQPAPQTPYNPQVQQTPEKLVFNCNGKADGFYELGKCHTKYVRCVHGTAYPQECPASLVFASDICDYEQACLNPTHAPSPQQQPPAQQQAKSPYGNKPVQQTPAKPAETFCQDNNLSEGYHSQGCNTHYFACSPQNTIRVVCPGGLYYDAEEKKCEYKYYIVACGGRKPLPPAQTQPRGPASTYGQGTQPQEQKPVQQYQEQPAQQQPIAAPQNPQQTYGQKSTLQQSTLPQSQESKQSRLQQTYNQQPAQQQPVVPSQQPQQTYDQRPSVPKTQEIKFEELPAQQQPVARPQQTHDSYTQQQPPASQQQTYGQPQVQQQPASLPQPQQPQPAYQQQPSQQQSQGSQLQPISHTTTRVSYPQSVQQQKPSKPVENFCKINGRADGFNGDGCSAHFFVCALGETTRLHCPIGLWYDVETNECSHKDVITACGGRKPTPLPAGQQPKGSYGQPSQQPLVFDCRRRKDGVYANGCSPKHYVCIQGNVRPQMCPKGTFYSAVTELCDLPGNVVECGGVAPSQPPVAQLPVLIPQSGRQPLSLQQPSTTPPPAWVPYPYQSQVQQNPAISTTRSPVTDNKNLCETLSNGIYGRKCSRFFFVCTAKNTYDFICPRDQAFNLRTVKCAPKYEIHTCPEFIPATARQPPVLAPKQSYQQQPVALPPQSQPTYVQRPSVPQPQASTNSAASKPQQQPARQPQPDKSYGKQSAEVSLQPQEPAPQSSQQGNYNSYNRS